MNKLIKIENDLINDIIIERQLQNITQTELAFKANLYVEEIEAIENKKMTPSLTSFLTILQALNLTLNIKYPSQYIERKSKGWCIKCGNKNKHKFTESKFLCDSCYHKMKEYKKNYKLKQIPQSDNRNKFGRLNRDSPRKKIENIPWKKLFFELLFIDGKYCTERVIELGVFLKGNKYKPAMDGTIRTWIFDSLRKPKLEYQLLINDFFNYELFEGIGWKAAMAVNLIIDNNTGLYYKDINVVDGNEIIIWTDNPDDAVKFRKSKKESFFLNYVKDIIIKHEYNFSLVYEVVRAI